jgi:hypothetical protein
MRIAPPSGEAPRLAAAPSPPPPAPQPVAARAARTARADHPDYADQDDEANPPADGEGEPLHRRTLIRAQLPRPVGEVPTRQAPTFTIREAARAPKFRRPFARNARPQSGGQNNGMGNGPMGRAAAARSGQQPRGKKGGASQQPGGHRFGPGQSHGQGQSGHHAKGRQGGNPGNKRFK